MVNLGLSSTSPHSLLIFLMCSSVILKSQTGLLFLESPILGMMCWSHYCGWDIASSLDVIPALPICLFLFRQKLTVQPRLTLNSLYRLSSSLSIISSSQCCYNTLFIHIHCKSMHWKYLTPLSQGRTGQQFSFFFCTTFCLKLIIFFYVIFITSWCCQMWSI